MNSSSAKSESIAISSESSRSSQRLLYLFTKRLFDIVFSSIFLIATSPIWFITAVGIKISSGGPILYTAKRVGKNGKEFNMLKFRSMHVDKNADEKSLRPEQNRIFRFGAIIRSTKIDELPQMWNVLMGQMTVVGPRPAAKEQIDITRGGKYEAIYAVAAGLTSPSALYDYIYGDTITDATDYMAKVVPTRLDLDLYYIEKMGVLYDSKMIIHTITCILASILHIYPKHIYSELIDAAMSIQDDVSITASASVMRG